MPLHLLAFCLRSLYREYGSAFLVRVLLAHPRASARGIARYAGGRIPPLARWPGGADSLVGAGFCLKSLDPPCPAGRANHLCLAFEAPHAPAAAPCHTCLIASLGRHALASGSSFYVMTSARDILHDVLLPALRRRRFRAAALALCRYSFEPIRLALSICGVEAILVPFAHGDCRDYAAWRRADLGIKPEQTSLDERDSSTLAAFLSAPALPAAPAPRFRRAGNVYHPHPAAPTPH